MEWDQERIDRSIEDTRKLLFQSYAKMREERLKRKKRLSKNSAEARCRLCGFIDLKENMTRRDYSNSKHYYCSLCISKGKN